MHLIREKRLYASVPASKLADILEGQWGIEALDEDIVWELLARALEVEDAAEPSKYVDRF